MAQRTGLGEVIACVFALDVARPDDQQIFCVQTGKENRSTPDFPVRTPAYEEMLCVVVFEDHTMPSALCNLMPLCSTTYKTKLQKCLLVERKLTATVEAIIDLGLSQQALRLFGIWAELLHYLGSVTE